jgi:thioredoxin-dependent peroxiredoxin
MAFQDAKAKFTRAGTVLLGISRDSAKANAKFAEKYKLTFPLLCDPDKVVHDKFGVMKEKTMYGKKVMGVDRSTFLMDPERRIRALWRKVKVDGHADEVLAALKAAQADDKAAG